MPGDRAFQCFESITSGQDKFDGRGLKVISGVVGGDLELAGQFQHSQSGSAYKKWAAEPDRNPQVIAMTLDGIWNLCADPATRRALEEAYRYFDSHNPGTRPGSV